MSDLIKKKTSFFNTFFDELINIDKTRDNDIKINLKELKNSFVIKADIPGVDKTNVDISLNGNNLTIKYERVEEHKEENEEINYFYSEMKYGSISRTILIPSYDIDHNKMTAKYNNGELIVTIPKLSSRLGARKINIE